MIKNTFMAGAAFVALSVGFVAGSGPVMADSGATADVIDRITVVEPRIKRAERVWAGVSTIRTAERDVLVKLDDLDLARTADLRRLEDRIHTAATRLCQELRDDLPHGTPKTPECIQRAVNDAMEQVEQATQYPVVSLR